MCARAAYGGRVAQVTGSPFRFCRRNTQGMNLKMQRPLLQAEEGKWRANMETFDK